MFQTSLINTSIPCQSVISQPTSYKMGTSHSQCMEFLRPAHIPEKTKRKEHFHKIIWDYLTISTTFISSHGDSKSHNPPLF